VNYDDETLMAYADGELDEAQSAAIAAAMERDPALARRVERHRALRAEVADAFASVLDQPVPERLVAAAGGVSSVSGGSPPQRRAEVLQFPARAARPPAGAWRAREWGAVAASLALGMLISLRLFAPPEPLMTPRDGALVARGALATALDRQLAGAQQETEPIRIGLTFRSHDGNYCRSFALRDAGTAGLACRVAGEWRIPVTAAAPGDTGDVRQAAAPPPAVLREVEARISGEPLDAAAEKNAQLEGWVIDRP